MNQYFLQTLEIIADTKLKMKLNEINFITKYSFFFSTNKYTFPKYRKKIFKKMNE